MKGGGDAIFAVFILGGMGGGVGTHMLTSQGNGDTSAA